MTTPKHYTILTGEVWDAAEILPVLLRELLRVAPDRTDVAEEIEHFLHAAPAKQDVPGTAAWKTAHRLVDQLVATIDGYAPADLTFAFHADAESYYFGYYPKFDSVAEDARMAAWRAAQRQPFTSPRYIERRQRMQQEYAAALERVRAEKKRGPVNNPRGSSCPACGSRAAEILGEQGHLQYRQCSRCSTEYTDRYSSVEREARHARMAPEGSVSPERERRGGSAAFRYGWHLSDFPTVTEARQWADMMGSGLWQKDDFVRGYHAGRKYYGWTPRSKVAADWGRR